MMLSSKGLAELGIPLVRSTEDEKKAEVVNTAKKENLIVLNQLDPILDYMVMTFCLLNLGKQYFS